MLPFFLFFLSFSFLFPLRPTHSPPGQLLKGHLSVYYRPFGTRAGLCSPTITPLPLLCGVPSPSGRLGEGPQLHSRLTKGFRIGVAEGAHFLPTRRNRSTAYERPDVISAYLAHEVDLGRMTPLPPTPPLAPPLLQLSPFGVIPKKHKPDKWRLVVDLSAPE